VAIEAVADVHTISSVEKMAQVQKRLASPALRVIYDPVNLIPLAGLQETQEEFFSRAFEAFGDKIAAIHAKDFRMENGKKNGFLPAGTGEMDYPSLFQLVISRKPGIDILLEDTSPQTGKTSIAFLRNIRNK